LWFGLIFYGYRHLSLPLEFHETRVKLVQSGLSQQLKWSYAQLENNFNLHLNLSQEGAPADIIIWPESAVAFDLVNDLHYQNKIREILKDDQVLISGFIYHEESAYNSLGVFTKNTGLNGLYHKHHLVPFGEYIPLAKYLPLETIARGIGGLAPGKGAKTLYLPFNFPSVSPAICYESIFSNQIIEHAHPPEWILIITNDAWYGNSRGPYQHLAEAQLRAIEEGLPVVRVGYNGISAIISPTGKILEEIPLGKQGILVHKIPKRLP
ncbi:MAG: apolipoprotein N-acyltransferase, partial [Alphaproteobacteria bacterium]|nr:apolipoprotein N-acyltransferase [Alphaproteobacteria bacterium]